MKTILQFIGLRSSCCNARIIDWHYNKAYCESCEHWVGQQVAAIQPAKRAPTAVIKATAVQ